MKTMLISFKRKPTGDLYINEFIYTKWLDGIELKEAAERAKKFNDLVYTIDIDVNHQEFINTILNNGTKM